MLDIKFIREHKDLVKKAILDKRECVDVEELLQIDRELVAQKTKLQELQTKRNAHSKKIPTASKENRPGLIEEGRIIGEKINILKPRVHSLEEKLKGLLYHIPAIPETDVPRGKDQEDNIEVKKEGIIPTFSFPLEDHVALLEKNHWAEFKRVAKVCGSRSYSLRDTMVWLEMAVHRLALDRLNDKGFTLISTPALVKEESLYGTGHLPGGRDQVYNIAEDKLFLSGTSEVQLNFLHSDEILQEDDLPILYAGRSSCFRREAGSYGRDVRGLMRVHEFTKVEQYIICKNNREESLKWHQSLLETGEEIVKDLELPYRIVECCTGDMGTGKVKMYDIECWVPSEKRYRETHSCSAFYEWQARRTNTRYRDKQGNLHFVHTLNNTAVATPRILVSLLECHQQKDGSIKVPKKLRPYLQGKEVLSR